MIATPFFRNREQLILASGSPRRRELLHELGLEFEVRVPKVPEIPGKGEEAATFVQRVAHDKAGAVARSSAAAWVLAADTVVVLDEQILGKPRDPAHARQMLLALAGRRHQVLTGFCLSHAQRGESVVRSVTTEVFFADFSEEIAAAYVATNEPMDKAGAYGIQGRGGLLVERITGSYSNVVGLPLAEVMGELLRHEVVVPGGQRTGLQPN